MYKAAVYPTFKRQRFLLAFIRQVEDNIFITDLQRLMFLYTMEEQSSYYEFVPCKFGPYSFQLKRDIEILSRDGYLSTCKLSGRTCVQAVGKNPQDALLRILPERGYDLIRKTYLKYPYYAINSEMGKHIVEIDVTQHLNNKYSAYDKSKQMLFTIGYEGESIEAFTNKLILNGVRLLCDVRRNPISRKFGFSKSKLQYIANSVGVKYKHMPNLGISTDKRVPLKTSADLNCLLREYAKALPGLESELKLLHLLLTSNNRIALMCFEKNENMCHRHIIKDHLTRAYHLRSSAL